VLALGYVVGVVASASADRRPASLAIPLIAVSVSSASAVV